jgi:fused signal recognition particle receptor
MDELKKVKRVLARLDPTAPHEVLLVLDGTIGQNAVAQAEEFNKGLGVTGLVITKLDGTAKGGVVLAIAQKLKIPIRFVGVGEQIEDFGVFNADDSYGAAENRIRPRPAAADGRMIRFDQVTSAIQRPRGAGRRLVHIEAASSRS